MKLAFSTDYWKGYSWAEYCSFAKEMQFSGIEIHDIDKPAFTASGAIFSENTPAASRKLANMGLSIPCLDTVFNMADSEKIGENLETLTRYLSAAKAAHAPYVRLYAKEIEWQTKEEADAFRF